MTSSEALNIKHNQAWGNGIKIKNVSKSYETDGGPIEALRDVSIEIKPGEFLAVVGPSGCGKSTLLKMVAGLLSVTKGSITIDEQVIKGPYTNLGIVFQRDLLLEWRTIIDNVLLQVEFRKLPRESYRERALELLSLVGLEKFENRYPSELSGGMRQRVAICRALLHNPPILLMDEPFGALDALTREQIGLDLQTICSNSNISVLFITHSISEAVFLADRVLVMSPRPGQIKEILDTNLPRPRDLHIKDTVKFNQMCGLLRNHFESMGILGGSKLKEE